MCTCNRRNIILARTSWSDDEDLRNMGSLISPCTVWSLFVMHESRAKTSGTGTMRQYCKLYSMVVDVSWKLHIAGETNQLGKQSFFKDWVLRPPHGDAGSHDRWWSDYQRSRGTGVPICVRFWRREFCSLSRCILKETPWSPSSSSSYVHARLRAFLAKLPSKIFDCRARVS